MKLWPGRWRRERIRLWYWGLPAVVRLPFLLLWMYAAGTFIVLVGWLVLSPFFIVTSWLIRYSSGYTY